MGRFFSLCAMRYAIFQVILGVPISFSFLYNPAELEEAKAINETTHVIHQQRPEGTQGGAACR
ncbi:MAG: hypothetical protein NTV04_22210, partial [Deltaproteobacteria bacterium]|nr:hypothetical protein [Deltaproteobacteria bacterium]